MKAVYPRNILPKAILLVFAVLVVSPEAWALRRCTANMNKIYGTISVRADGVHGTLHWGWDPNQVIGDFVNEANCVMGTEARRCRLGAPGTPERVVPPPLCKMYLKDDTGSCQDYIAGCVPGARPICPPDMEQIGSWCVDRVVTTDLEFNDAVASCQSKGRSLCPLEAMIECDAGRNGANYPANSCADVTDGGTYVWTITPDAADNQNFFTYMTVYQDNNIANVQSTGIGSLYKSFCCSRVGAQ